jgi:hypothetical protein
MLFFMVITWGLFVLSYNLEGIVGDGLLLASVHGQPHIHLHQALLRSDIILCYVQFDRSTCLTRWLHSVSVHFWCKC